MSKKKNPHIGSTFESWLDEAGLREEVTVAAIKAVIARQLADEMKKKKLTKKRMAELMKTSRAKPATRRTDRRPRIADGAGLMQAAAPLIPPRAAPRRCR